MTKKQAEMVNYLKENILLWDSLGTPNEYEYKRFEVDSDPTNFITVYSIVGRIGDEETMSALLCRNIRQIFIGKNGGLSAYRVNPKTGICRLIKGLDNVRIYCYEH